jgi:hypothetical protein
VNTANTMRPAHLLQIIEALVIGGKLLGDVYELHNAQRLAD